MESVAALDSRVLVFAALESAELLAPAILAEAALALVESAVLPLAAAAVALASAAAV